MKSRTEEDNHETYNNFRRSMCDYTDLLWLLKAMAVSTSLLFLTNMLGSNKLNIKNTFYVRFIAQVSKCHVSSSQCVAGICALILLEKLICPMQRSYESHLDRHGVFWNATLSLMPFPDSPFHFLPVPPTHTHTSHPPSPKIL